MTEDFGLDVAILGLGFHVHYVSKRMRKYYDGAMKDAKGVSS